jgi:hypothetical protein
MRSISNDEFHACQLRALVSLQELHVKSEDAWHTHFAKETNRFARVCAHCNQVYAYHVKDKCLFSPFNFLDPGG